MGMVNYYTEGYQFAMFHDFPIEKKHGIYCTDTMLGYFVMIGIQLFFDTEIGCK